MISKELFLTTMGILVEWEKAMDRIRGDLGDLGYLGLDLSGDSLEGAVVDLMDAGIGFSGDACPVSWWWWDCCEDRRSGKSPVVFFDGKEYRISTPEQLYDYSIVLRGALGVGNDHGSWIKTAETDKTVEIVVDVAKVK